MRRKLDRRCQAATPSRGISRYVEKTGRSNCECRSDGGHLHMHGENVSLPRTARFLEGTSPCAWRKHRSHQDNKSGSRNISTYAEKTWIVSVPGDRRKVHLHIRGENRPDANRSCVRMGNISTCVEKTGERPTTILRSGTSPRMRRER